MPEKKTVEAAKKAKREGKAPSSQAGEFVREEIHHLREGKHGARSTKQAIAIGLSKARRAGVRLAPPSAAKTSNRTKRNAEKAVEVGRRHPHAKPSPTRSRASLRALKKEPAEAGTSSALSRQARAAAARRPPSERSSAARQAVRTKGPSERSMAARKGARTRKQRS